MMAACMIRKEENREILTDSQTEITLLTECGSFTEIIGKVEDDDPCIDCNSAYECEHFQSSNMKIPKLAKFHECLGPVDLCPQLKLILPPRYDYVICNLFPFDPYDGEDRFSTVFRLPLGTAEEAEQWLHEFQSYSKTTWRVDKTYPDPQTKVIFKKDYRCQHNTRSTSHKDRNIQNSHRKNTNCPAKLTITVKKFAKRTKSEDPHAKTHATMVCLKQTHNHKVMIGDALRHRPVSDSVRTKFMELYKSGLTPPQALTKHQSELRDEFGDGYEEVSMDRYLCPDIHWCYRLYYKLYRTKNTTSGSDKDVERLESRASNAETLLRKWTDELCGKLRQRPTIFVPVVEKLLTYSQTLFDDDSDCLRMSTDCCLTDDEKNDSMVTHKNNSTTFSGFTNLANRRNPQFRRNEADRTGFKRPCKRRYPLKSSHTKEHDYSSLERADVHIGVALDSKAFPQSILIPAPHDSNIVLSSELNISALPESWGIMFGHSGDVPAQGAHFEAVDPAEQDRVEHVTTLVAPHKMNDSVKEALVDVSMQYDVGQTSAQAYHFISDENTRINIVHVSAGQNNDASNVADLKELLKCF